MSNIYQELLDKVQFFKQNSPDIKIKQNDLCLFVSRKLLTAKLELEDASLFLVYDGYDDNCNLCEFVLSAKARQIVGENDLQFLELLNKVYKDVLADYLIQTCDNEGSLGYLEFKLSSDDPKQNDNCDLLITPYEYGVDRLNHNILHREAYYDYQIEEIYYGGLYLQLIHQATDLKMVLHVSLLNYEVDYINSTEKLAGRIIDYIFQQQPALKDFKLERKHWQTRKDFPAGSMWYLEIDLEEINISLRRYNQAALTLKLIKENN